MEILRCPDCKKEFKLEILGSEKNEISTGILHCADEHFFPVVSGIPRMLPSSLKDYWAEIKTHIPTEMPQAIKNLLEKYNFSENTRDYDMRTKANFSNEWDNHDIGGKTWTMELNDRVKWYFLQPIKIPKEELKGKIMLDAGCGNGSQSVAYTEFGLEVVALDLSTGLEKGYAFNRRYEKGKPENVHFVQADLQNPPLTEDTFDIIHSAGVLHHTPNTEKTFRALRPLLKDGGVFYIWLYKYEKFVTPILNTMRAATTRIPAPIFAKIAGAMSFPFIGFCWMINKMGIRQYEKLDRREAMIAVHDIFGAPYAHYHSPEEVKGWFDSVGITESWKSNDNRRGFGICGRIVAKKGNEIYDSAKA